jgi:hypothetical protein
MTKQSLHSTKTFEDIVTRGFLFLEKIEKKFHQHPLSIMFFQTESVNDRKIGTVFGGVPMIEKDKVIVPVEWTLVQ